jgi:hypothetical protein
VGVVTLERIFRIVLFPAPFKPMIETDSPSSTEKEIFFNAQNSFDGNPGFFALWNDEGKYPLRVFECKR